MVKFITLKDELMDEFKQSPPPFPTPMPVYVSSTSDKALDTMKVGDAEQYCETLFNKAPEAFCGALQNNCDNDIVKDVAICVTACQAKCTGSGTLPGPSPAPGPGPSPTPGPDTGNTCAVGNPGCEYLIPITEIQGGPKDCRNLSGDAGGNTIKTESKWNGIGAAETTTKLDCGDIMLTDGSSCQDEGSNTCRNPYAGEKGKIRCCNPTEWTIREPAPTPPTTDQPTSQPTGDEDINKCIVDGYTIFHPSKELRTQWNQQNPKDPSLSVCTYYANTMQEFNNNCSKSAVMLEAQDFISSQILGIYTPEKYRDGATQLSDICKLLCLFDPDNIKVIKQYLIPPSTVAKHTNTE